MSGSGEVNRFGVAVKLQEGHYNNSVQEIRACHCNSAKSATAIENCFNLKWSFRICVEPDFHKETAAADLIKLIFLRNAIFLGTVAQQTFTLI